MKIIEFYDYFSSLRRDGLRTHAMPANDLTRSFCGAGGVTFDIQDKYRLMSDGRIEMWSSTFEEWQNVKLPLMHPVNCKKCWARIQKTQDKL